MGKTSIFIILALLIFAMIIPIHAQSLPFPKPIDQPPIAASKTVDGRTFSDRYVGGYNAGYDNELYDIELDPEWQKAYDHGVLDKRAEKPNKFDDVPDDEETEPKNRLPRPPTGPIIKPVIVIPIDIPKPLKPDDGDPFLFGKNINVVKSTSNNAPLFDLYSNGTPVKLSRIITDSKTLCLDWNVDGQCSDGQEWLFSNVSVYLNLRILDTNENGFFDYADEYWEYAMIQEGSTITPIYETDILGFAWQGYSSAFADMHTVPSEKGNLQGTRQYSDCLYDGVFLYDDCIPVSDDHFAITSYFEHGVIYKGGETESSYGIVMGYLD